MINKDALLDTINNIKQIQRSLIPVLPVNEDFVYANIQLQIAIRLIEDGLCRFDDDNAGAVNIVFVPEPRR